MTTTLGINTTSLHGETNHLVGIDWGVYGIMYHVEDLSTIQSIRELAHTLFREGIIGDVDAWGEWDGVWWWEDVGVETKLMTHPILRKGFIAGFGGKEKNPSKTLEVILQIYHAPPDITWLQTREETL